MKIIVHPNTRTALYVNSHLQEIYEPGVYRYASLFKTCKVFSFSILPQLLTVSNQEILTKDNIAFRLSFLFFYKIVDVKKMLQHAELDKEAYHVEAKLENMLTSEIKIKIREKIADITVHELNENRKNLFDGISEQVNQAFEEMGIIVEKLDVMDISFPKSIQDSFAKLLEARIRAQTDLENARTQVAAARALKNAAEILKGDKDIKYLQFMELISRIASKGNHSFVIGTDHVKIE